MSLQVRLAALAFSSLLAQLSYSPFQFRLLHFSSLPLPFTLPKTLKSVCSLHVSLHVSVVHRDDFFLIVTKRHASN